MVGPFRPKQNHKAIGERSEAIIIAKFLEVRIIVRAEGIEPSTNRLKVDCSATELRP